MGRNHRATADCQSLDVPKPCGAVKFCPHTCITKRPDYQCRAR
ncbi:hypothetical protein [Moraxella lacunata]